MPLNLNLLLIVMIFLPFSRSGGARSVCELARDRKACEKSLSENPGSLRAGGKEMTQTALNISIAKTQIVRNSISNYSARSSMNAQAVDGCSQLYDLTADFLIESSMQWKDAVDIQSYQNSALIN
ncbi:hypothetical protein SUGI_1122420 [Cryptomeria japonica]|nr:hypothetical protein SUGI_1122420 [Cryptomeria japonica]